MDIRNLYEEYFDNCKISSAYQDEPAYMEELFQLIDMLLAIACTLRMEITRSETNLAVNSIHLRGVPLTLDELLHSLTGKKAGEELKIPYDAIKKQVGQAMFHLKTRLAFTKQADTFCISNFYRQTGISDHEKFLLLLSMVCYDRKQEPILMYLQGDVRLKQPTIGLALFLWELGWGKDPIQVGKTVACEGYLFHYFLEVGEPLDGNPMARMFVMPPRMYAYLCAFGKEVDKVLEPYVKLFTPWIEQGKEPKKPDQEDEIEEDDANGRIPQIKIRKDIQKRLLEYLKNVHTAEGRTGYILNLYGGRGIGKRYLIKRTAADINCKVLFVDLVKILKGTVKEVQILMRKIAAESILNTALVCFCYMETQNLANAKDEYAIAKPIGLDFILEQIRKEFVQVFWLSEEKADYLLKYDLHVMQMELPILTVHEKIVLWENEARKYPIGDSLDVTLCANQYVLSTGEIKKVLHVANLLRKGDGREQIERNHVKEAVAQQAVNQLGRCATLIQSIYTWDDLVISPEQRRQMDMICNQIKYRNVVGEEWGFYKKTAYGRGVCALFYGSPGTGKTMAVQIIANELGLDLYRVDLSGIVSKYIGETEKNITELFDRAKHINALLFFDEADALFAKRSEVKDSHDRNANSETAHLLQKLEDYEGIVILATNFVNNIDDAFKRRIKFMVNYAFPTEEVRKKLWTTILPPQVPCEEELDLDFFAEKFELSGSSIKEILTNAAYIAAASGGYLANRHIVEAVKINFAKYGKILNQQDFEYLGN
ncbi:ATP-binding protein [Lachnospiraceae bacterium ZAX-1]